MAPRSLQFLGVHHQSPEGARWSETPVWGSSTQTPLLAYPAAELAYGSNNHNRKELEILHTIFSSSAITGNNAREDFFFIKLGMTYLFFKNEGVVRPASRQKVSRTIDSRFRLT